jgi:hypothetical protein
MWTLLWWACASAPLPAAHTVDGLTAQLRSAGYTVTDLGSDPVGHGAELAAFNDRRCLLAARDDRSDTLCVWTCATPTCDGVGARRMVLGESYGVFEAQGSFLIHRRCADDASPAGFDCVRVRRDLGLLPR